MFHEYGLRSAAFSFSVKRICARSFSVNYFLALLRQKKRIGGVIMDLA